MHKRSSFSLLAIVATLAIVTAITLGLATPVQAAEIRENGVLNANETIDDDLIIGADRVQVDGTVNGMLVAGGTTVMVTGVINGDAFLFGQDVIVSDKAVIKGNLFIGAQTATVNGEVTGSIAAGSASMAVTGKVGRNLYYGGYSLETRVGSTVARGLYFGGYQALLNGSIAKDLNASAGAVELDGSVGGSALLDVASPGQNMQPYFFGPYGSQMPPSVSSGLRVGPNAKIGGQLVYTSEANQNPSIQSAPGGGIVYRTPTPKERGGQPTTATRVFLPAVNWFFNFVRGFVTLLLLGLLAVWLLPVAARGASEMVRAKPVQSAGYGLLTILVGYVGAFVAALLVLALGLFFTLVTLGGLSSTIFGIGFSGLTVLVTAFTLLVSYASKLVIAYLVGDLLLAGIAPTLTGRRYWAVALGVLIYSLVRAIPFLGWLVAVIVTILGVGAMWLYYRSRQVKPAAATPEVTAAPAG